jgi:hypothetical protein
MADPILDEDTIVALLKTPVSARNVNAIQAGAVQALIDLYDRKCTREEFVNLASPCIALYGQAAKLALLANVEIVYDSGDLDKERFNRARDGLIDLVRKQTETVIDVVKRLQLCAGSQDHVH